MCHLAVGELPHLSYSQFSCLSHRHLLIFYLREGALLGLWASGSNGITHFQYLYFLSFFFFPKHLPGFLYFFLFEQFLKQFYQEKRLILSRKPFSEMFWDKFYLKQILEPVSFYAHSWSFCSISESIFRRPPSAAGKPDKGITRSKDLSRHHVRVSCKGGSELSISLARTLPLAPASTLPAGRVCTASWKS